MTYKAFLIGFDTNQSKRLSLEQREKLIAAADVCIMVDKPIPVGDVIDLTGHIPGQPRVGRVCCTKHEYGGKVLVLRGIDN